MGAADILTQFWADGFSVALADNDGLIVRPGSALTPSQRQLLVENKPALLAFLADAKRTADDLIAAAALACDHHGDSAAARDAMRADCLATPLHQRQQLIEQFLQQYPPNGDDHA